MNPIIDRILNKVMIEKAMGREMAGEDILSEIEKSLGSAPIGEIRTWSGVEYIKTPKGWRRKPKGYKEGGEKKESDGKKKRATMEDLPHDGLKVMDALQTSRSEYNDPSKVTVESSPKGNWILYYDGKDTGVIIGGDVLRESTVRELGWEHHDTGDDKNKGEKEGEKKEREKTDEKKEPRFGKDIPDGAELVHGEAPMYGGIKSPYALKRMSTEELRELLRDFNKFTDHYLLSNIENIPFGINLSKELGRRAKKEASDFANEAERRIRGGRPGLSALTGSDVTAKFIKEELPKYNANLDPDNKISRREFKDLIVEAFSQRENGYNTPIDDVLDGKAELSISHLNKLIDYFWDDLVG